MFYPPPTNQDIYPELRLFCARLGGCLGSCYLPWAWACLVVDPASDPRSPRLLHPRLIRLPLHLLRSCPASLPLSLPSCLLPSLPASKAVTELIVHSRPSAGPWGCKTLLLASEPSASQREYTHPLCAVRGMRRGGPIQPAGGWDGCSGEPFVPSAES